MRKIKKVKIDGFWGDRSVSLDFTDDINFLICPRCVHFIFSLPY